MGVESPCPPMRSKDVARWHEDIYMCAYQGHGAVNRRTSTHAARPRGACGVEGPAATPASASHWWSVFAAKVGVGSESGHSAGVAVASDLIQSAVAVASRPPQRQQSTVCEDALRSQGGRAHVTASSRPITPPMAHETPWSRRPKPGLAEACPSSLGESSRRPRTQPPTSHPQSWSYASAWPSPATSHPGIRTRSSRPASAPSVDPLAGPAARALRRPTPAGRDPRCAGRHLAP